MTSRAEPLHSAYFTAEWMKGEQQKCICEERLGEGSLWRVFLIPGTQLWPLAVSIPSISKCVQSMSMSSLKDGIVCPSALLPSLTASIPAAAHLQSDAIMLARSGCLAMTYAELEEKCHGHGYRLGLEQISSVSWK